MLSTRYRFPLRSQEDFFLTSQFQDSPSFRIYWTSSPREGLVVVVPKKVSSLSTVRNRIKRVVTHYFEENLEVLSQKNVVIVVKPNIQRISRIKMNDELSFLFTKASL